MKRKKALVTEAKKFVRLSLDAKGVVSPERVRAILDTLNGRPAHKLRPLLKAYQRFLSVELGRGHGLLEHAGALQPHALEALTQHLHRFANRPVTLTTRETPSLIAGLRVTLGDHVWEASVSSRLATLHASL